MSSKKVYVLDTNIILTDYEALYKFGTHDIVVPLKVLEEIDEKKKRQDIVGFNARNFIKALDELREKGSLVKGVRISKGLGQIRARNGNIALLPDDFDKSLPDNIILSTALAEKEENPEKKIIVVSLDINLRVRCDSLGLACETYNENQVVTKSSEIFTGYSTLLVEDEFLDQFYAGHELFLEKNEETKNFKPNQFIVMHSKINEKKSGIAKFVSFGKPLEKTREYVKSKEGTVFGLSPKNKEQQMALNLLMDPNVPVVTLMGTAGCGKTLLAVAAALEFVINGDADDNKKYERIIISRPVMPLGKDIGFLPGTADEKLRPWIAPIEDNLDFLFSSKSNKVLKQRDPLEHYRENGVIQVEALTYIRGRSLSNAFIIFDECQNMTMHEIKTVLTRVGENTKIVLTGDVSQIDNLYLNDTNNGLTHVVEKFKDTELAGHITLIKGERSKVATFASKVL